MRKGFTTLDFLDIFLIDTRPPILTLDENTERVSGHNVTLKWRSNEYAIFKCAVDSIFDDRDCGSGRDSEIKLSNLDDGPHTIWIKANDELGNIAPWKKHTWNVGELSCKNVEFSSSSLVDICMFLRYFCFLDIFMFLRFATSGA